MRKNSHIHKLTVFTGLLIGGLLNASVSAQNAENAPPTTISELTILPAVTDSRISAQDDPHLILYDPGASQGKLLLFLPGTNGRPERGPKKMFNAAVKQGYRVINLSYNNKIAVARICRGETLEKDSDCTEKFRTQRVFGDQLITSIPDKPHDAILNRFEKLLTYLNSTDKDGNWDIYLKNGRPNWDIISVTG